MYCGKNFCTVALVLMPWSHKSLQSNTADLMCLQNPDPVEPLCLLSVYIHCLSKL
jgi:hypothetical protein